MESSSESPLPEKHDPPALSTTNEDGVARPSRSATQHNAGRKELPARLRRLLVVVETTLLVLLFAVMFGVAVFQIGARNLFGSGIVWGQDLVQVAMLWLTMVGAYVAVGENRHIRIDVVARFGSARLQALAARITTLFGAVLCAALGWFSIEFVRWDFIDNVPGFASVPAWVCESIIPIAAFAMALRFALQAIWPPADSHA